MCWMVNIRMTVPDLASTRFAYSPLAEVGESLYLLSLGPVHGVHEEWYRSIRPALAGLDMELLSVVTVRPRIADFLFAGAVDATTTIESQLQLLSELPADDLAAELRDVWHRTELTPRVEKLIAEGPPGPRRLADALFCYWTATIEPHWPSIRATLDEDVAHRTSELARRGMAAMLAGMHPNIAFRGDIMATSKDRTSPPEEALTGGGMRLVPSVFAWPHIVFSRDSPPSPSLTYPARGVGNLWNRHHRPRAHADPLAALLGRSRAQILVALTVPACTTDLAASLAQSAAAVSQHLSVLRRTGL